MSAVALTHEGEIILVALQSHRVHIESHQCDQCMQGYQALLEAITQWVKRDEPKEAVATSQPATQVLGEAGDPLAVFGVKK